MQWWMNASHSQTILTVQQVRCYKKFIVFQSVRILSNMGDMKTSYNYVKCLTQQSIFTPYVCLQTNFLVWCFSTWKTLP